jgi:kynurenine 3-monooxygenase
LTQFFLPIYNKPFDAPEVMTDRKKTIAVVGAGLVGSLISIYLKRRGYSVSLLERRGDMRKQEVGGGRSINLALSNRGIKALNEVGLADAIRANAIPMHGRMVHMIDGQHNLFPYGKEGQFINSISRSGLNMVLLDEAEKLGVEILFNSKIDSIDIANTKIVHGPWSMVNSSAGHRPSTIDYGLIIGADGVYSAVRGAFQISDRFDYSQTYIEHGYKELSIPAREGGAFRMEKNALHIWPRESFMLIALPNPDGSFTCTLFFSFEGPLSFASIKSKEDARAFFTKYFPDALALMPTFDEDFMDNPVSSLVTVRCFPWAKNNSLLIGDAAHGIVPFFGQGMNAGFEDCRVLNDLLNTYQDDWEKVLPEFQSQRKPDADAIAQLALDNFIEMRDLVDDPRFILRKKIETKLHQLFPDKWVPLYSMVTFHENTRYSEALKTGQKQKAIMDEVLCQPDIENKWQSLDFENVVNRLRQ